MTRCGCTVQWAAPDRRRRQGEAVLPPPGRAAPRTHAPASCTARQVRRPIAAHGPRSAAPTSSPPLPAGQNLRTAWASRASANANPASARWVPRTTQAHGVTSAGALERHPPFHSMRSRTRRERTWRTASTSRARHRQRQGSDGCCAVRPPRGPACQARGVTAVTMHGVGSDESRAVFTA